MKPKSQLQRLLQLAGYLLRRPKMAMDLVADEDFHHSLALHEHEAFYFLFTSADGKITGGLRTLFGPDDVLEIVGLRVADQGWVHQSRVPYASESALSPDASGPLVGMNCVEPWSHWQLGFAGEALNAAGQKESLSVDLTFHAINPPVRFDLGDYHQAQQDGCFSAVLHTPQRVWEGELTGYRDHSWGYRGNSSIPGWMIIDIPGHLYAFIIGDIEHQYFSVGRITKADGTFQSVVRPRVSRISADRWQIEDRKAGFDPWSFAYLGQPGESYIGGPGEENVQRKSQTGDSFVDHIGPALFVSSKGESVVGFWDEARRIRA